MNNYEFFAKWVLDNKIGDNPSVLDYGCGSGEIVILLRNNGITASGCDVFYEAGDYSEYVDPNLFGTIIKRMEKEGHIYTIPFADNAFDFVISNQVMEHVEDLDAALSEINRVLKPGGAILNIFPHKGVWREGHTGIPFLQMFPKHSSLSRCYAILCGVFGFGYNKRDRSIVGRSYDYCNYLDQWTHYKSIQQIHIFYNKYFTNLQHIETYWLRERLGKRHIFVSWIPQCIQALVIRSLCDLVFTARKPSV